MSTSEKRQTDARSAPPSSEAETPPNVPGYRPLCKLGEGTYGKVWLYEDLKTGVKAAVKFFLRGAGEQWLLIQAEVRQLALMHADPGIIQLLDAEPQAEPPYFIMKYAEGGSLATRLQGGRTLPLAEAVKVFRQATEALAYVHAKGVRHCDLKPGNVLLDKRGRALLADFGQAHLASDLAPSLGTFFYMAPEQATLTPTVADPRWDVYGLGALLYAMLTGRPPRDSEALRQTLAAVPDVRRRLEVYRDEVARAGAPDAHRRVRGVDGLLADVIDRCLAVDSQQRYADAGAVLEALERRRHALRRRPVLRFGLIAPLVVLVLTGLGGFLLGHAAADASERALVDRLQTNNRVASSLIAGALRRELEPRIRLLELRASDERLLDAVQKLRPDDPADREALCQLLEGWRKRNERSFLTWAVARDGRIVGLASSQPLPNAVDLYREPYSWRDWYNGQRHYWGRKDKSFPPVDHVHVSGPYVRRDEPNSPIQISITCPIKDAQGRVVGLLVGGLTVAELAQWLDKVGLTEDHSAVLILNQRRQFLRHPEQARIRPPADADPPTAEGELFVDLIERRRSGSSDSHRDPLDGKRYLAGYAPVDDVSGWGVVVQHDREEALAPVQGLRTWMRWFGLLATVVVGGVTAGLWLWLYRALRRQEAANV
jgi:hypothetical protein